MELSNLLRFFQAKVEAGVASEMKRVAPAIVQSAMASVAQAVERDLQVITPQIVYKVAICLGGNLPYIQITSIVISYSQSTNYLVGTYLSWRKSALYPDHFYSATLYPVTL